VASYWPRRDDRERRRQAAAQRAPFGRVGLSWLGCPISGMGVAALGIRVVPSEPRGAPAGISAFLSPVGPLGWSPLANLINAPPGRPCSVEITWHSSRLGTVWARDATSSQGPMTPSDGSIVASASLEADGTSFQAIGRSVSKGEGEGGPEPGDALFFLFRPVK
jgi:hypothetical protein